MAGNANSGRKADKLIGDALRLAAKRVSEGDPLGRTNLAIAAEKIVELACTGDIAAFREMADRIDGKPKQQTELSGPDGEAIPVGVDVRIVSSAGSDT